MFEKKLIFTSQQRFENAVSVILNHEGGYTNDPEDPGGETNFGITYEDLKEYGEELKLAADVKKLTREDAIAFYKNVYWDKYHYNAIVSLPLATKIFDMSVNMGPSEAHTLVQRALFRIGFDVKIDGILGPQTFKLVNTYCLEGKEKNLKQNLIDESKYFYRHLVQEKPNLRKFLTGWLNRAEA